MTPELRLWLKSCGAATRQPEFRLGGQVLCGVMLVGRGAGGIRTRGLGGARPARLPSVDVRGDFPHADRNGPLCHGSATYEIAQSRSAEGKDSAL